MMNLWRREGRGGEKAVVDALKPWTSMPLVDSVAGTSRFEVKAIAESADEISESSKTFKTLELGALFGLWYLFNIYFNIYNKQVLKAFSYPITVTGIQFVIGTVLVQLMWGLNLYKKPKVSGARQLCHWRWCTLWEAEAPTKHAKAPTKPEAKFAETVTATLVLAYLEAEALITTNCIVGAVSVSV